MIIHQRNEVFSMVFRGRNGLGLKSWRRGKLAVNVTEKTSPLGDTGSTIVIVAYTPQEITGKTQTSAQISGIADMALLRRAQMLQ
jgi:hypothetical protein